MKIVQLRDRHGRRAVAASVAGAPHRRLTEFETVYELTLAALENGESLARTIEAHLGGELMDLAAAEREGRLLPPIEHPVPTRCWVTASEQTGAVARWHFRGNGSTLTGAGQPLVRPAFDQRSVAVPHLFGCYVIGDDGTPLRIGWALGQALVDLACLEAGAGGHAHLRPTAVGPELLVGALPAELPAELRLVRAGKVVAQRAAALLPTAVLPGQDEREAEHFRYGLHRRPGDVHVHGLAAGAALAAELHEGDVCELGAAPLGLALRNPIVTAASKPPAVRAL